MTFNIAIDGPSAAGKSTIAKLLAQKLNYIHLDTGAMYRCIAYKATLLDIDVQDEIGISAILPSTDIHFDSSGHVFLDNKDVTNEIRREDMSWLASSVSVLGSVRSDLVRRQQELAAKKGIIMDGRDIGTVVMPDAEIKIFLTADVNSRAARRFHDQIKEHPTITLAEIREDIIKRDLQDTTRLISPLKKADDAIEVDTTNLSIESTVELILSIIEHKRQEVLK
ncbi:MAG: (d)CMP kinase [Erysipelotrichaceae bacterium]|nr:(d)CMP kinase [Erysipelotrichaceae bacterium]